MKVKIKETGELKELNIFSEQGINFISDFIGNTGALFDGQFIHDEENDVWVADKDTFEWWDTVIDKEQELIYRIDELKKIYGSEEVYQVVQDAGCDDLENNADMVNDALDVAFTELD